MARIRVTARKEDWRDFMGIVFVPHHEVNILFKWDGIVAYGMTPDGMKIYDIKVYSRFFPYRYDVSEEYEDLVFTIYRREFYNALRDLKEDILELWYDEKSGSLKLAPYDRLAEWRFVGEKTAERLPPYPALDFVNGTHIIGFHDYVDLRRYAGNLLATFEWRGRWLNVRIGTEDGSVIIRVPDNRLSIYRYGADTWATYELDHIDLPEVGEPTHVQVEMPKGEQLPARFTVETWGYTYKLYVSPKFDARVPEPPRYKEKANFHFDDPEPLRYLLRLIAERELYDNVLIPKNFRYFEFLGLNPSGSLLVTAYIESFFVTVQMIERVLIIPNYADLATKACELKGRIHMDIDENDNVRLCDVYIGEVVRPRHTEMLRLIDRAREDFERQFDEHAQHYAYIEVLGDKLAKAIGGRVEYMDLTAYPDGRAFVEIDGLNWTELDLLRVKPPPEQTSTTVKVEAIPVLPAVRALKHSIIRIGFYDKMPTVFDYDVKGVIRIIAYARPSGY
jgi:hypothetical protein